MANGEETDDVKQILQENGVTQRWESIINIQEVKIKLKDVTSKLRETHYRDANQILQSLSYCEPEDIKVVIIGSNPDKENGMENGLLLSANTTQSRVTEVSRKILSLHKALEKAKILNSECDYYCGHQEWAAKGVLLLNDFRESSIYEQWRPFLEELLKNWIVTTELKFKVFIMLLDNCDSSDEKSASDLWESVNKDISDEVAKKKIDALYTVWQDDDDFVTQIADQFEEIFKHNNGEYKNVFETRVGFPYYDVNQFLEANDVEDGWKKLIVQNKKLRRMLKGIIGDICHAFEPMAPAASHILRAFAYCEPQNIQIVIIGTSPVIRSALANGLSFSSNNMEREFNNWERENAAIPKVHEALRKANVLDTKFDYYCGHEEWAKNGVLLLNAALTIPTRGNEYTNMCNHCDKWKPFLVKLLNTWMKKCPPPHRIAMMIWGYQTANTTNFAMEICKCVDNSTKKFLKYETHHPTFPKIDNRFIEEASIHFRDIVDYQTENNYQWPNPFATEIRLPRHDVSQLLSKNKVKIGWEKLIKENNRLRIILQDIVNDEDHIKGKWIPATNQILRAFSYCEPEDVKVVVIGKQPSVVYGMANGLSFSANRMESACSGEKGRDIRKVHYALRKAKILRYGVNYLCGHEEWAKNGVLLLNAALTIDRSGENLETHSEMWRLFLAELLKKWIDTSSIQHNVYVMLWGNNAETLWKDIGDVPESFLKRKAHHPTDPKQDNNFIQEATKHFEEIANEGDDYKRAFRTPYAADITAQLSNLSLESST